MATCWSTLLAGKALVDDLLTMLTPPTYVADTPLSTYGDAVELLDLVIRAEPDFALPPGDGAATTAEFLAESECGRPA